MEFDFPYEVQTELTGEAKMLAEAAKAASRAAIAKTFAAGLPIVVGENGKIVRVYPDGTKTILGDL
ncbi:MAG: hypothetical protein K6F50_02080 [Kiritimatiellae bacterium]|nr:hypothetical protein [Kiritimatiellia bacterium]